jgi:hypothetical protein
VLLWKGAGGRWDPTDLEQAVRARVGFSRLDHRLHRRRRERHAALVDVTEACQLGGDIAYPRKPYAPTREYKLVDLPGGIDNGEAPRAAAHAANPGLDGC